MILKKKFTQKDVDGLVKTQKFDWNSWEDLKHLWRIKKSILKEEKDFIDSLFEFDVRSVTPAMVTLLFNLYRDDPWMDFDLIKRESEMSGYLFVWSQKLLEFIAVCNQMGSVGIKGLEDDIIYYQGCNLKIRKILSIQKEYSGSGKLIEKRNSRKSLSPGKRKGVHSLSPGRRKGF